MSRINIYRIMLLSFVFIMLSCDYKNNEESIIKELEFNSNIPKVKIADIKISSFTTNINSNGKLQATKKIDLKFENEGIIDKILVNDGDFVKKGEIISYQGVDYLKFEEKKNEEALLKAKLDIQDILIGFGYDIKDSLSIPKEILEMAKSRSNFSDINNQIVLTKKKQKDAVLRAPFSGVIANTNLNEKSLSSTTDKVCTLINSNKLLVEFFILESEYSLIKKNMPVSIFPIAFPNDKYYGSIEYINPLVNENGLILIKAIVENDSNELIDGMNVNISIDSKVKNVLVIPKNALVVRQNRKVVFTLNNGKAQWNYVETSQENRDSIVIIDGLKKDDKIIIEGNVNLAHNSDVLVE